MGARSWGGVRPPRKHRNDSVIERFIDFWDCPRDTIKCWKNQSKRRHQYYRTPHFDLYEPYERDECGIVMTDAQIEQMCYLLNTYKCATI